MAKISEYPDAGLVVAEDQVLASRSGQTVNVSFDGMALQTADAVNITGGSIAGITDLSIADGGTGGSTAGEARTNLGLEIGSDIQAHSSVLDATTASFTTADETKLDGIEALADVTDEANVKTALDGATIPTATVGATDKVLLQDVDDADNLKVSTAQAIANLSKVVNDTTPQLGGDLDTNGHQVQFSKGADVASATALPIVSDGNYFDVTGTTTITSIATTGRVGTVIKLHFDGILTLTHNATDLILPGGANITTAAGDEAEFVEYAAGDWRCTSYTKASGEAVVSADGGVWNLLETQTASASATIDFTTGIDGTYTTYAILVESLVPATDSTALHIRTSTDGGVNYDAGGTDYRQHISILADNVGTYQSSVSTGQAQIIAIDSVGSAAGEGASGIVYLHNPSNLTQETLLTINFNWVTGAGNTRGSSGITRRASAADVDAIRFIMSSGNITSGTFKLYGIL